MITLVVALAILGTLALFCGAIITTFALCLVATLMDKYNKTNELDGELYIEV